MRWMFAPTGSRNEAGLNETESGPGAKRAISSAPQVRPVEGMLYPAARGINENFRFGWFKDRQRRRPQPRADAECQPVGQITVQNQRKISEKSATDLPAYDSTQ